MREGFYWVRSTRVGSAKTPEVAEWSEYDSEWKLSGSEMGGREQDFEVLSERLVPPERLFEVGLQCPNHLAGCFERCPNCVTPPGQTPPPGQRR